MDYIEQVTEGSTIFEEEYVDPREMAISFPEERRNLILIYLESMETTYASVEAGGGKEVNYIPELTELAFRNLFFLDYGDLRGQVMPAGLAGQWQLLASSSGIPYKLGIEWNSADRYERFLLGLVSLEDVLLENGYRNYFMCGSDIGFAGQSDFYRQYGSYKVMNLGTAKKEGIVEEDYHSGFWEMEDERLFAYAKKKLADIPSGDTPFNFTLLTVETHHQDSYVCSLCERRMGSSTPMYLPAPADRLLTSWNGYRHKNGARTR